MALRTRHVGAPRRVLVILVTALGHDIEVVIVDVEQLVAADVAGIGVEDSTALVPVEHAVPLPIGWSGVLDGVVEVRLRDGTSHNVSTLGLRSDLVLLVRHLYAPDEK